MHHSFLYSIYTLNTIIISTLSRIPVRLDLTFSAVSLLTLKQFPSAVRASITRRRVITNPAPRLISSTATLASAPGCPLTPVAGHCHFKTSSASASRDIFLPGKVSSKILALSQSTYAPTLIQSPVWSFRSFRLKLASDSLEQSTPPPLGEGYKVETNSGNFKTTNFQQAKKSGY